MPEIPDVLKPDNHPLWLLIGVSVAMVFTLQAVQEAVEGAWPHERRSTRMMPQQRSAQHIWALDALLVLLGGVLLLLNLAMLTWKNLPRSDTHVIGSLLLGICWVLFLLISFDRLGVRNYLTAMGPVAPLAVMVILLVANVMLTIALVDIHPSMDDIREALPVILAHPGMG